MDPFPQDWELLWVFECEPIKVDVTDIVFDSLRDKDRVLCHILPLEDEVLLSWWSEGVLRVDLKLRYVRSLEADTKDGVSALIFAFRQPGLMPLKIQFRPAISFEWGTNWYP